MAKAQCLWCGSNEIELGYDDSCETYPENGTYCAACGKYATFSDWVKSFTKDGVAIYNDDDSVHIISHSSNVDELLTNIDNFKAFCEFALDD